MKNSKYYYKSLHETKNLNGFRWWGFIDGIHNFSNKEVDGWINIECTDDNIENGDIEFMCEKGLTLSSKSVEKIQKKYLKEHDKTNTSNI